MFTMSPDGLLWPHGILMYIKKNKYKIKKEKSASTSINYRLYMLKIIHVVNCKWTMLFRSNVQEY